MNAITVTIAGTAPYVQDRFPRGARPLSGDRDLSACMHVSTEGWNGIPVAAIREVLVHAGGDQLRYSKIKLSRSIVVQSDGNTADGIELVRFTASDVEPYERVGLASNLQRYTVLRPMWRRWSATITIQYLDDELPEKDLLRMLKLAGSVYGIGTNRPSMGGELGTFKVAQESLMRAA